MQAEEVPLKVKVYDEFGNFLQEVNKAADVKWALPEPHCNRAKKSPPALEADVSNRVRAKTFDRQESPCRSARLCFRGMARPQGEGQGAGGANLALRSGFRESARRRRACQRG